VPKELLTTTEYNPALVNWMDEKLSVEFVALGMATPLS